MHLKHGLALFVLLLLPAVGGDSGAHQLFQIPNTQVIPIKDTAKGRHYELYIKLPEDYAKNSSTKYPVIYTTDAMWHVEILSASTAFLFKDVILVGISWQKDMPKELIEQTGVHVSRFRDYSIKESSKPEIQAKYQLGQAQNHMEFIQNEVFSYMDKHYRTDPKQRTYFGYSLGACLVPMYCRHNPMLLRITSLAVR